MNVTSENRISRSDIYYFRQRQKNKVFQSVLAYFSDQAAKSRLTKKELAERIGRDPATITRWFSGPSNWRLDTISDLLRAMNAEMKYEIVSLNHNQDQLSVVPFDNGRGRISTNTSSGSTQENVIHYATS